MSTNSESFSILIIGEARIGKTALAHRFTSGTFDEQHLSTIGIDYHYKDIQLNNYTLKITIWDTAGQEKFSVLTPNYFKKSQGIIFVFDITNRSTFEKMDSIISGVKDIVDKTPFLLIGNKNDLPGRQVKSEEGEKLADTNGMIYFECSAKEGNGVTESFLSLAREILHRRGKNEAIIELENYVKKNCQTQIQAFKESGIDAELKINYSAYTLKLDPDEKNNKDNKKCAKS